MKRLLITDLVIEHYNHNDTLRFTFRAEIRCYEKLLTFQKYTGC